MWNTDSIPILLSRVSMPTILLSLDFARHILLRSKGLATWTLFDHDSSILALKCQVLQLFVVV